MLKLKDIKKTYIVDDKRFPALKNINLSFPNKGFISILGPSGCGKTTLLNLIGGLDQYTSGDLIINNKSTKKFTDRDWDAYRNKRVGFVFQTYNLVPHLTVLGNVELSMTLTGMNKRERQKKAITALKRVGLKDAIYKKPNQLSGGQMQRVAIARSLVNNPEIVLADEPTGALDSVTSVQVMEILKEVAKDRLVIMVTHNNELAKQYSTRIIRLKDGRVISDTHPQRGTAKKEKEELEQEKNKHTHMSFLTALGSSAKSLATKKGRTAMTAVAASFGIIGVALVLAMSNGFQGYVGRVEMETASSVPITVSPYVTTAIKEINPPTPYPAEEEIKPYDQDITQLMVIHRNRLSASYADYCKKLLELPQYYASSILENHEYLDFNIFTERKLPGSEEKEVIKINQFDAAGAGASILSGVTSLPSTIFHELYGNREYINSLYDVIYGTYPSEEIKDTDGDGCLDAEVCLVCDRYNRIPMTTLYELGLSSTKETKSEEPISFKSIIDNTLYKAYMPDVAYTAVSEDPIEKTLEAGSYCVIDKGSTLEETPPIYNLKLATEPKTLKAYKNIAAKNTYGSYIYADRLNEWYRNEDNQNKPIKIRVTGIIRPKRTSLVNLMPGSICYNTSLKDYYVDALAKSSFASELAKQAKDNFYIPKKFIDEPLGPAEWAAFLYSVFGTTVSGNSSSLEESLNKASTAGVYFYSILTDLENPTPDTVFHSDNINIKNYLRSNYRFANNLKAPIFTDYGPVIYPPGYEGYQMPYNVDINSIDDINDVVSYVCGYSPITSILIFPKTLNDKHRIFTYLDKWNEGKADADQIKYSDIAGTLTDALGTMIDIISIVLIVFSSVSLLVSCVMTGVITYTSVLERTKEIGILRAIGARKKDVGRLFEAESVIIGGIAGLAGVLFTFIVQWPISLIINARFPEQQIGMICNLSPWHALILVIISILLTFIAGFIPARKASKKDPVVALRTE